MPTNHDIRERYIEAIRALAKVYGAVPSGYEIPQDATLAQCIGYAQLFIVGRARDEPHYRYNRYMRALEWALRQDPAKGGTVIHVDIGCGPGLFTWVVRDYFRDSSEIHVELYGYDHSVRMVELAYAIWNRFDEGMSHSLHHTIPNLLTSVSSVTSDRSRILVTLGHVLVQTVDDDSAISDFARIIAKLAPMANCQLMAVDAQTGSRPDDFHRACSKLSAALERLGLIVGTPSIGRSDMVTSVRVAGRA